MLAAMLLLGILPLVALPFIGKQDSADDVEDLVYRFGPEPRLAKLAGFVPGKTTVEIDLTEVRGDIVYTPQSDPQGFTLSHSGGRVITVRFPELRTLPLDDVTLHLTDPFEGGLALFSLRDVIPDGEEDAGGVVIAPFVAADEIIAPTAYAEPYTPSPELPAFLEPVASPVAELGTRTVSILAAPKAPNDETANVLELDDFFAGEDVLRLTTPNADSVEVTVGPSPSGADGWVMLDGALVAILRGAPDATEWDVYLEQPAAVVAA